MQALFLHSSTHGSVQQHHHHQSHSLSIAIHPSHPLCHSQKRNPQQTLHVHFCQCCVFHQRLTQHFHAIIPNTVVCSHKPTQHAINPTTSSQPLPLSTANTLHRSSGVSLMLVSTNNAICSTHSLPIWFPVDSQTSCRS